jgi:hypothetical protein
MKRLLFGFGMLFVVFLISVPSGVQDCMALGGFPGVRGDAAAGLPPRATLSWFGSASQETVPVRVSMGWLEHSRGLTLADDLPELLGGIENTRQIPLRGVRVSLTMSTELFDGLALELSGATLLARESDGRITSNIGLTADFESEGLEWSYLQSLFRLNVGGDFSLLAGVRWDHTTVRFHVTRPPTGNDDFIINGYTPLVGVQVRQKSPAAHMSVRLLGFPAVPGNLKFHTWSETSTYSQKSNQDFSRGYCMEVEAKYGRRVFDTVDASLFGRWDLFHATTPVENALAPAPVQAIRWTMDRKSWTLGMGISCRFSLL